MCYVLSSYVLLERFVENRLQVELREVEEENEFCKRASTPTFENGIRITNLTYVESEVIESCFASQNIMSKTVGIVGAGVSRLVAIKICLEEGLQPTAFEKSSIIGGLWNYDEDTSPSSPGRVYKSLVANICKVNLAYSDFPMSANTPPFPSHEQYVQYLHEYTDYFKLQKHIQVRTEVMKIKKADDYEVTGKWTIDCCQEGKETVKQTFDFIMICSGYFRNPIIPHYPGLDKFTGKVLHTAQYRRREQFADKKVFIIGGSVSGIDIATDISFASKQLYISARNGFWIIKKSGLGGYPFDCLILNRFNKSFLPAWLRQYLFAGFYQIDANYDALGIKPNRPIFTTTRGINDYLLGQLMNGKVKPTPAVKRFLPNCVEFIDGTKLNDLDVVIFATGYTVTTPFIDDNLVPDDLDTRDLYKYVFPVRLPHATLACIGLVSTDNNASMLSELQCRWSIQVRGSVLSDELANDIGCYPSIKRFMLTDPRLAFKLMFAPLTPSSYRLMGPRRWSGARKAVVNSWEDSLTGLSGKIVKKNNSFLRRLIVLAVFLIILIFAYQCHM